MDFWELFITALMPVLKVLLVTALGTFLALDRFDVLGEKARKNLNSLVFFVFSPALVTSNLAQSITFRSMIMLWFMPINILLTFIFGSAFGWILVKITRAPRDMQGLVLGCCSAGNLGNLVFIIVLAVCKESSKPFGAVDVCFRNGLAYASLSMAIGAVYLWSYVYNIVRIYSCKSLEVNKDDKSTASSVSAASEIDPEDLPKCTTILLVTGEDSSKINEHVNQLEIEFPVSDRKQKPRIHGYPLDRSGNPLWRNKALRNKEDNTWRGGFPDSAGGYRWILGRAVTNINPMTYLILAHVPKSAKLMQRLKAVAELLNMKALLAPSTIGSIIGLIIGTVPQLRKTLVGDKAPLRVLQDSASLLGDAAIPTITLIVGANLLKGLKKSGIQLTLIVGIILIRFIALPVLGVGIVKGASYFGLIHPEPLYQFVLLLQFALPPAINMGTITQLFGAGESECSVIMLATYACASVSLTLWCTFFMWLVL
ncbi:hypothetical protein L6164_012951 [Bauhinia variegata]|uniref:Uncharacterized protein n=1 Tax=Bauhinia variegata TaxID=167791 RepID=A0ACB9PB42_BAUVA|nr:hypothetical protein L6164_012951 [Bauhinia variegata]